MSEKVRSSSTRTLSYLLLLTLTYLGRIGMKTYLDLMHRIRKEGVHRPDRTGVGTLSIFGAQLRFNLSDGFPAVTTKRLWFKGVVHELLWFISGSTNIAPLTKHDVHIWDAWANEDGELGPVYGSQWRSWRTPDGVSIDQLATLIDNLKTHPHSRRHIISAWAVHDIQDMALPPCHTMFQFYVSKGKLSCQLYQRSADIFLGVPFNIASYALLTHMIAQVVGLQPGDFVHTFGDLHLYTNHLEQAATQLERKPHALPTLHLNPDVRHIEEFSFDDIKLLNYTHHPAIKAPIAV